MAPLTRPAHGSAALPGRLPRPVGPVAALEAAMAVIAAVSGLVPLGVGTWIVFRKDLPGVPGALAPALALIAVVVLVPLAAAALGLADACATQRDARIILPLVGTTALWAFVAVSAFGIGGGYLLPSVGAAVATSALGVLRTRTDGVRGPRAT